MLKTLVALIIGLGSIVTLVQYVVRCYWGKNAKIRKKNKELDVLRKKMYIALRDCDTAEYHSLRNRRLRLLEQISDLRNGQR